MNNKCPLYRSSPFKERNLNKFNKILLNETKINCPLYCNEIFKYEFLEKHLKNYRYKFCNWESDIVNNNLTDILKHDNDCNALIQCQFCFNIYESEDIDEHIDKLCEEKVIFYEVCKIKYPAKYKTSHDYFFAKNLKNLLISYKIKLLIKFRYVLNIFQFKIYFFRFKFILSKQNYI